MIVYGSNTIRACLEAKKLKKVMVSKGFSNHNLIEEIQNQGIQIKYASKEELDKLAKGGNHQSIIGEIDDVRLYGLDEILRTCSDSKSQKDAPILVILDSLTDPHNLGAILRSCDAFNVSGVIYKKHGSVGLNDTVAKVSTGAINFVKCCEVTNLTRAIQEIKKHGFWVVGLDGAGEKEVKETAKNTPICLVVGSEGYGISRLVRENCDYLEKIEMFGRVNCLNASVACSIALYALRNL